MPSWFSLAQGKSIPKLCLLTRKTHSNFLTCKFDLFIVPGGVFAIKCLMKVTRPTIYNFKEIENFVLTITYYTFIFVQCALGYLKLVPIFPRSPQKCQEVQIIETTKKNLVRPLLKPKLKYTTVM